MSVNIRSPLYFVAKLMGGVNAVKKRKVGKRIGRRAAERLTGRTLGKWFK